MKLLSVSSIFLLTNLLNNVTVNGHGADEKEDWKLNIQFLTNAKLPIAKSDMTAVIDSDGYVYLTGGCDHPEGNTNLGGFYGCTSITNEHIVFDTSSEEIVTDKRLPNAPTPRYRHAAVLLQDLIFLIGGRDVEDGFISDMDVYEISTENWYTVSLPLNSTDTSGNDVFMTSDLFAFGEASTGTIYYGGGYDGSYTARAEVYSFLVSEMDLNAGTVTVQQEQDMTLIEARGDAHAVLYENSVYLAGGFTHDNSFCAPLTSVEKIDLNTRSEGWKALPDLGIGRGDKALVAMNDYLFAIGGEGTANCGTPVAYDDVEVLDIDHDAVWLNLGNLPNERFRFVAVAHPSEDVIYTFGGQEYYNSECDCYATSDAVTKFTYEIDDGGDGFPVAAIIGIVLGAVFIFVIGFYVFKKQQRGEK